MVKVLCEKAKEAYQMLKHLDESMPTLKDIKVFHFALNNVWQLWMCSSYNDYKTQNILSNEITLVKDECSNEQESLSMNELDVNQHMGFTLESPEDVTGIVQRFLDLFENRKFNKINEAQASLERRIKEAKASELFDPKINARSEKLVGRDSSIPRV